jgi:hypothetical protein
MLSRMESPLLSARSPCQKNDPATSPCDDAASSIEMSGILPDTDAPANLVHGAMGTGPLRSMNSDDPFAAEIEPACLQSTNL